jgi:hypothetical protein
MTVEITQGAFVYTGDGTQASFPTPFFATDADIYASLRPLQGASVPLQLGSQYTLTGAGQPLGGTLTIIDTSVLPRGSTSLFITTNAIENQLRDFGRVGSIDNREYTRGLDKLTMLVQETGDGVRRSLHAPIDDLAGDMVLPLEYLRASTFQGYDFQGKPLNYSAQALADLLAPYISGEFVAKTLPKSREELGLQGDGFTDDSINLRKRMLEDSAVGGATYFLQPQDGRSFYFQNPVLLPSNINLIFSGIGASFGPRAYLGPSGDVVFDTPAQPYRLISDHAAGVTRLFIDTGPRGGGLVSTHFPAGTQIAINGFRDATATPDRQEYRVVSSDASSITIDRPIPLALPVAYPDGDYQSNWQQTNYTEVLKVLSSPLAADAAAGQTYITITPALYQPQRGDWLLLLDDKTTNDEAPGATLGSLVHLELFQVVDLNTDGPNTVSLNRRLEHAFETAYRARVVMLAPCQGSSVSGCSAAFTAAPTASVPTFRFDRSIGCIFYNAAVRNEDQYGSLGPMFQAWQSADCVFVSPVGRNPKAVTGGAGVGCSFLHSVACMAQEPDISGCRHNLLFEGSTHCHATDTILGDDRVSSIQFMGSGEVGCTVSLRTLIGGGRFAPDSSIKRAIRFGLPEGMVGPYRCIVEDGRVAQYKGAGTAAVEFCAGSEECRVTSAMDDVETALWGADSPLNPTRLSRKNALISTVNGYAGRLADINGARSGGSLTKTIQDLRIELRAFDGSRQITARNVNGLRLRVEVDKVTPDVSEPYAVAATNIDGLKILRSDFTGVRAGIFLDVCPGAQVAKCLFIDFVGGTEVLHDSGTNTGMVWRSNDVLGFAGTGAPPPETDPPTPGLFEVLIT